MRIRKRFPSLVPSSVASSKEVPTEEEEMEVSSFPTPAEGKAREAPEKLQNDWLATMAEAHRLLGCSSNTFNYRTIRPHVQEEHSSANPVTKGESVTESQSTKERKQKRPLAQESPSQTMVIEQGGGKAGKQMFDFFSISEMKGNCFGTAIVNAKGTTVSSSSCKGDAKGIFAWKSEDENVETTLSIGGSNSRKGSTNASSSMQIGSLKLSRADGSHGMKYKEKAEEERYSSGSSPEKKVKTRSLTSIYADIRSRMPSFSKAEWYGSDY
ncbi:hypothetical protein DITRI_Ditri14bG0008600 [Diplodiscus trichospermus]